MILRYPGMISYCITVNKQQLNARKHLLVEEE
jgi:hypothetical protein